LQDYDDALNRIHFKAEGDVEFKALLFIPKRAPWDFYDNIQVREGCDSCTAFTVQFIPWLQTCMFIAIVCPFVLLMQRVEAKFGGRHVDLYSTTFQMTIRVCVMWSICSVPSPRLLLVLPPLPG
jgi:hypothetical protein